MDKNAYLQAKSIHVFAWAFEIGQKGIFKGEKKTENAVKNFKDSLLKWDWIKKDVCISDDKGMINKDMFMLKQYLSEPAEDIFLNNNPKEAICAIYEYPMGKEAYYYHIKKGKNTYELPLDGIELHIYDCGVGIIFFKALNFTYYSIDMIKEINDYGRRIKVAYVPNFKNATRIWADEIGIKILDHKGNVKKSSIMEYEKAIEAINDGIDEEANTSKIANYAIFLKDILYGRFGKECTKDDKRENKYSITTYSDDRMFLISMIRDTKLSQEVQGLSDVDGKQTLEQLSELEEKVYSIVYADPKWATCTEVLMRREILEGALYKRWLGWGSLYGVTSYSYVAITDNGSGANASVVCPFYKEYLYLISLVLAQRIGISIFSKSTTKNAQEFNRNKLIHLFLVGKQSDLQKRYIIFKNQMLLTEPSCQEQGIDIYKILQKQLLINNQESKLESQLKSLYESINISWEKNVALFGGFIAVIGSAWKIYNDWDKIVDLVQIIWNIFTGPSA